MADTRAPIRVELTRDVVESVHLVDAVVATVDGPVTVWGDADAPVIPRSAIKPIQVLPLLRTGAAEAFGVSDIEVSLGAASHSGQPKHVEAVAAWLERIGFSAGVLECGADRPIHVPSADDLLATGRPFAPIHNCCSGKHTGFLTVCRHLGFDPEGYIGRDHPIQALVTEAIEEFTEVDLSGATNGADGCGIPTFTFPAHRLAHAMARLVTPAALDATTTAAAERVVRSMSEHAWWMSGTDRAEDEFATVASERLVSKGGAEGVFMAALPERGIGIALKARDGAHRAADQAMAAVLADLGVLPAEIAVDPITNKAGTVVGEIRGVAE